jgi:hypothetical protein
MKKYQGNIFFEEDNFKTEISGAILTIENDKYTIEFQSNRYFRKDYNIIQGEFLELGYVSFIECHLSGSTMGVVNLTKYNVQHIITEIKINKLEDLLVRSLHVTMDSLNRWIKTSSLKGKILIDGKIEYIKPEKMMIYENDDFQININFCLNEYSQYFLKTITLTEFIELEIFSKKGTINIFDLFNIYKKIKIFLAFIGVFSDKTDELFFLVDKIISDVTEKPRAKKFLTKKFDTTNNGIIAYNQIEFNEICASLSLVLDNWLNNSKIQDSIILVMEKYTFIKLTVETYFLNTCFAIETFHRKNKKNKVFSEADFKKIKTSVRAKLTTEDEINLFNDKLIFANEPTFKNRLLSLKTEFQVITVENFDIDEYINKIVKTRNYLVHRGSKTNTFSNLELYYASVYLETLTKYCVMEIIGINKLVLDKIFLNSGKNINQLYENISRKH